MRTGDIHQNWSELVNRSSELSTLEQFGNAKTWLEKYLEGEPKKDEATRMGVQDETRPQQPVEPNHPPLTLSVSSLPDSLPEVAAVTNKGAVLILDPVPDISMSTAHKGDVNTSLILATSLATMPQMIDMSTTGLRRSCCYQGPSQ